MKNNVNKPVALQNQELIARANIHSLDMAG